MVKMSPGGGDNFPAPSVPRRTISPLKTSHEGQFHHSKRPTRDNFTVPSVPRRTTHHSKRPERDNFTAQNVPRGGGDSTAPNVSRGTISPPKTSLGGPFHLLKRPSGTISPPQTSLRGTFHRPKRPSGDHFTLRNVSGGAISPPKPSHGGPFYRSSLPSHLVRTLGKQKKKTFESKSPPFLFDLPGVSRPLWSLS